MDLMRSHGITHDILNSIKPTQQKAVTGLDEFVLEGVEAWRGLSGM